MNIYNYNSVTCEYTGNGIADQSPLEPGVYLIPAFSTSIEPPKLSSNKAAIFDEIKQCWSVISDYRQVTLWNKATAQKIIAALGVAPADINATIVEPTVEYPKWDDITETWIIDEKAQLSAKETAATYEIQQLLSVANEKIAPLQDAVDLGMATDSETASLTKWKTYRVLVNRVTSQSGFPTNIDWPVIPE